MTEPTTTSSASTPRKRGTALGGKVLAELQEIAAELGISGTAKMRKGALIDAIKAARGEAPKTAPASQEPLAQTAPTQGEQAPSAPAEAPTTQPDDDAPTKGRSTSDEASSTGRSNARGGDREGSAPADSKAGQGRQDSGRQPQGDSNDENRQGRGNGNRGGNANRGGNDRNGDTRGSGKADNRGSNDNRGANQDNRGANQDNRGANQDNRGANQDNRGANQDGRNGQDHRAGDADDDGNGRRRNRRGRGRANRGADGEPTYAEDDVLVPAAGILDILDNYAFVRTTGYLPSENDVYVSLSMVRKLGLRRGDAVVGQVRQPREGERKEKFNPMVRVDVVNGVAPDDARERQAFDDLTPLYPSERLQLETDRTTLTTRAIDLLAPIGKGQRGLIASAPKAGRTVVLKAIADAITINNPECHLMVVLVDERPEEVTEMQRSVKGEVIASTFDRAASDHTTVAELAIERAKRLVELGHDVVVLLDSLTRLGRAYNQGAPASSRAGASGVDVASLAPVKRFFGAARNAEGGGSLTILATAHVETGSPTDEAILEEFAETANSELRLRRDLAERLLFPAIDVHASGTRRDELLTSDDERSTLWRLRTVLAGLDAQQGLDLVLERLRTSSDNADLLRQAATSLPADR